MKIGILTFHRPINYGAYLQAFSLSNMLTKRFPGVTTEIIDYFPPKEKKNVYKNILRDIKRGGMVGGWRGLMKKRAFKKAQTRLLLSGKHFCTNKLERLYNYIELNYDCLIIGSDAVFNWNQTGFPTPFIPDKKLRIPVMTYAASVHGMRFFDIEHNEIKVCEEAFRNMSFIGTRDYCSEQFVRYCCSTSVPIHCCDPTVFIDTDQLADQAGTYKTRIKEKYGISLDKKYIVVMSPDSSLIQEITRKYGSEYTIVHVFEGARKDKHFLFDISPFEWAEVLANASAVITRFFHGTLLSLVHGTPTIVIDYSKYNGQYESKLKDLMITRFNLPELYFEFEFAEDFNLSDNVEFELLFDRLLRGEYKERIIDAVKIEQKTVEPFIEKLESIINEMKL